MTIQELIDYLTTNHHTSRNHPVTSRDLARNFHISDGGVEVEARDVIRNAIAQNHLIGSTPRGYYLIGNSKTELEQNLNDLEERARAILQRRNTLRATWNTNNATDPTTLTDLHPCQ